MQIGHLFLIRNLARGKKIQPRQVRTHLMKNARAVKTLTATIKSVRQFLFSFLWQSPTTEVVSVEVQMIQVLH